MEVLLTNAPNLAAGRAVLLLALLAMACGACRSAGLSPEQREEVDRSVTLLADRSVDTSPPLESDVLSLGAELIDSSPERHTVSILHAGCDALTARLHLIRAARESIDLQTFIWGSDDTSTLLFSEVVQAARRGVRVRLIVDQMGMRGGDTLDEAVLAHANVGIKLYNPIGDANKTSTSEMLMNGAFRWGQFNQRMHNKLMVVDGTTAIIGGRNIQDRYFDADPTFDYIDRDVLIVGPVVAAMAASFEAYWQHPTALAAQHLRDVGPDILALGEQRREAPEVLPIPARLSWADERGSKTRWEEVAPFSARFDDVEKIQFEVDPPGKRLNAEEQAAADATDSLLFEARKYIAVQSNYLVFSEPTMKGLARLREEHPEVEVHYSTNSLAASGAFYVYGISRKQRFRMVRMGLQIHELRPRPVDAAQFIRRYDELVAEGAGDPENVPEEYIDHLGHNEHAGPLIGIHAKSISIDGRIAIISSHNFDPRSEYHNTEAGVAIYDERVCTDLEVELERAAADGNSWRVGPAKKIPVWSTFSGCMESISRELPIFDIWPWRYASCYELRPGMEPVSALDPRFHDHYRRVGQFPEVPFGWKDLKTRFMSAFMGFTASLM